MKNNIPIFVLKYYINKEKKKIGKWEGPVEKIIRSAVNDATQVIYYHFSFLAYSSNNFDVDTSDFISLELCKGQDVPEFEIDEGVEGVYKLDIHKIIKDGDFLDFYFQYKPDMDYKKMNSIHIKNFKRMTFIPPVDKKEVDDFKETDLADIVFAQNTKISGLIAELKTAQETITSKQQLIDAKEVEIKLWIEKYETAQETIDTLKHNLSHSTEYSKDESKRLNEKIMKVRNHYEIEIKKQYDKINELEDEINRITVLWNEDKKVIQTYKEDAEELCKTINNKDSIIRANQSKVQELESQKNKFIELYLDNIMTWLKEHPDYEKLLEQIGWEKK